MGATMLCFGLGYTARVFARRLMAKGWRVVGTTRSAERAEKLKELGFEVEVWGDDAAVSEEVLKNSTHWLVSTPPDRLGDPVFSAVGGRIKDLAITKKWIGYISSTSVYGDREGQWVEETTPPIPTTERGRARLAAERLWRKLAGDEAPVHVFRAAGIYGPGRNVLAQVKNGTAVRVSVPGHFMNRIHVEDLVRTMAASINAKDVPNGLWNVADDEPEAHERVISYAARMLKMDPPPLLEQSAMEVTPGMASFYAENKRVRNEAIKARLGVRLAYPTYREGLEAIFRPKKR